MLLDLSMPDMDGLEAIPLMREKAPDTRLVVLSGHEAGRVSLEALDQGASRYLNKAADFDAIRAAVHEVAKLEQPFTDERFSIVHQMWNGFLNGAIDDVLQFADTDMVWHPCLGGRELRSPQEVRSFLDELVSGGQRRGSPRLRGGAPLPRAHRGGNAGDTGGGPDVRDARLLGLLLPGPEGGACGRVRSSRSRRSRSCASAAPPS